MSDWGADLSVARSALYSEYVQATSLLEHFRNPHNAGELSDATATVEVTNPVCGDVLRLAVRVEGGRILAARFKTQGCVAAIASSSALTDMLGGKTLAEARQITAEQISSALGGFLQLLFMPRSFALTPWLHFSGKLSR